MYFPIVLHTDDGVRYGVTQIFTQYLAGGAGLYVEHERYAHYAYRSFLAGPGNTQ